MSTESPGLSAWERAKLAADAFALDWLGSGVVLRSGPGPARDAWLERLRAALPQDFPMRRIPGSISDDRLAGGLDVAATIRTGRPVAEPGVLALTDGGVLVLAMAERASSRVAARLAAALDSDGNAIEPATLAHATQAGVGVVALDEGCDDSEAPHSILLERCTYIVDLSEVGFRDIEGEDDQAIDFEAARARLARVSTDPSVTAAVVAVAARMGIASLRAPLMALRAARAIAALDGRTQVEEDDVALAATLTLSPRATRLPEVGAQEPEPEPQEEPEMEPESETDPQSDTDSEPDRESTGSADDARSTGATEDVVLAAAKAAIPASLLAQIEAGSIARSQSAGEGKSGASQVSARRGRPIAARAGSPREGRVSFIATLRAAAPWQPLRRRERPDDKRRVLVRKEDFRIVRYQEPRGATAIFVVDASGSSAMYRLDEVKGAIELLLADCYVRRDSVALIAFRGQGAEIVLPPTRSTARARRSLAGLPGGGGTPLASGLDAAVALADQVLRKGQSPLVVLMTDGRANVCRDGAGGRARAMGDAIDAARRLRAAKIRALAIDTSAHFRSGEATATKEVADAMQARYVRLPLANAALVNEAVRASWRPLGS
jgi:magnesium chelatase subunit D